MNDCLITYIEKDILKTIKCEEIMQWFQNMKNRRGQLNKISYVWKNKLKFTFYVRFLMTITLSYSYLLILLLILINFFRLIFYFQSYFLISPPCLNFLLCHWFTVKGLVRQWQLWTMSLLSHSGRCHCFRKIIYHFCISHFFIGCRQLSPSVYFTFLTFVCEGSWVLSLSLSRSTSLLLYLKKQTNKIDVTFFYM